MRYMCIKLDGIANSYYEVKPLEWLVLFGLLMVLAYAVYQTNVYILLRYQRRDDNDHIFIRIYAWRGLLSYIIKVPVVQFNWRDEMVWLEAEMKETTGNKRMNTVFERHLIKKVIDFICYHPRRFRLFVERLRRKIRHTKLIIRKLHDKVRFERFICQVRFGLEDAALTAILAGGFEVLRGIINSILQNRMSSGVCPLFKITPVFGKELWLVDVECILRIQLGNIINAFYNVNKQGGNNRG